MGLKGGVGKSSLALRSVFKSDQNGIESMSYLISLSLLHMGSNQTKMGLKVDAAVDADELLVDQVQIRPKWDWKHNTEREHGRAWLRGSNQTKMGLKESSNGAFTPWSPVQIRPKWDWKRSFQHQTRFCELVQIRPKWDWKCGRRSRSRTWKQTRALFKSDQNGIES